MCCAECVESGAVRQRTHCVRWLLRVHRDALFALHDACALLTCVDVLCAVLCAGARNYSQCDSMLIGDQAGANTYPYIQVGLCAGTEVEPTCSLTHMLATIALCALMLE